jgi:hypothetical protein
MMQSPHVKLIGSILLGVILLFFAFAPKPAQNISSRFFPSATQTCVPIQSSNSAEGARSTSTPTPNPSQYGTIPPLGPSVTPIPYSKITDLSPDSPQDHKGQFIVFHCDGTYELFLTAGTEIPLQPGDHILNSIPPAFLMASQQPPIVTEILATDSPTP